MLQLGSLGAHALHFAFTRVANLCLELAARGAEEVCLVLDVGLGDEAFARKLHVIEQHLPHAFHDSDALRRCVCRVPHQLPYQAVCVEVVDVGRGFEMWRLVLFYFLRTGHVQDAV